jgi:hypothetical protein
MSKNYIVLKMRWHGRPARALGFVLPYHPSFISYSTVHVLLLLVTWGAPKPCIGSTSSREVPSNPSVASCTTRAERRSSLIILCATTNMQRLVLALLYCVCFFLAVHMHFIFSKICRCFHHPWSAVVLYCSFLCLQNSTLLLPVPEIMAFWHLKRQNNFNG